MKVGLRSHSASLPVLIKDGLEEFTFGLIQLLCGFIIADGKGERIELPLTHNFLRRGDIYPDAGGHSPEFNKPCKNSDARGSSGINSTRRSAYSIACS